MKKKIINKGYTIHVTSWENDGDNYETNTMTVATEEEAKMITKMCSTLFKSCNNGDGGIGNLMQDELVKASEIILDYVNSNPEILMGKKMDDEEIVEFIMEKYNYPLMGGSEWYYSRVFESYEVTYSDQDVSTKVISLS